MASRHLAQSTLCEEDALVLGHAAVWGSLWEPASTPSGGAGAGRWGYACCRVLQKGARCTREGAAVVAAPPAAGQDAGEDEGGCATDSGGVGADGTQELPLREAFDPQRRFRGACRALPIAGVEGEAGGARSRAPGGHALPRCRRRRQGGGRPQAVVAAAAEGGHPPPQGEAQRHVVEAEGVDGARGLGVPTLQVSEPRGADRLPEVQEAGRDLRGARRVPPVRAASLGQGGARGGAGGCPGLPGGLGDLPGDDHWKCAVAHRALRPDRGPRGSHAQGAHRPGAHAQAGRRDVPDGH
mmetsp:Transcript_50471/g.156150  ORF Transcript_50471/g.156150 Transcript_50471/m.156150 type:complete len:297 (+) Transcript_50471:199-1089(+)